MWRLSYVRDENRVGRGLRSAALDRALWDCTALMFAPRFEPGLVSSRVGTGPTTAQRPAPWLCYCVLLVPATALGDATRSWKEERR